MPATKFFFWISRYCSFSQHLHMHTRTHTHTHARARTRAHARTRTRTHTHTHTDTYLGKSPALCLLSGSAHLPDGEGQRSYISAGKLASGYVQHHAVSTVIRGGNVNKLTTRSHAPELRTPLGVLWRVE